MIIAVPLLNRIVILNTWAIRKLLILGEFFQVFNIFSNFRENKSSIDGSRSLFGILESQNVECSKYEKGSEYTKLCKLFQKLCAYWEIGKIAGSSRNVKTLPYTNQRPFMRGVGSLLKIYAKFIWLDKVKTR